jgi:hypothetical protein
MADAMADAHPEYGKHATDQQDMFVIENRLRHAACMHVAF